MTLYQWAMTIAVLAVCLPLLIQMVVDGWKRHKQLTADIADIDRRLAEIQAEYKRRAVVKETPHADQSAVR